MLYTIFQIIVFQAIFLLVYDFLLRKETFFNYNRAYLIITSIISLVLPFVRFPKLREVTTKDLVIQLPEVFIGEPIITQQEIVVTEQAGIMLEQPQTPLWQIIAFVGMGIATLIFAFKIFKLVWLKSKNPKRWKGDVLVVKLINSTAAFSFFKTIFLGEQILTSQKSTIYKHELVHVKQWHSLDLLFFECLRILLWFNPLVYIYQIRIKELHEFIADAKAVKQNGKKAYYQSLLNQIFNVNSISFTNTFYKKSLIKKRIAMLQKSKSSRIRTLKYALLLPLLFGMVIYTSTEVMAQQSPGKSLNVQPEQNEEPIITKYYNELVAMEKSGRSFLEIAKSAGMDGKNDDTYIISKEAYYKSIAYMRYLSEKMVERKSENGELTDEIIDLANKMKLMTSYAEHRDWLKTDEAKDRWEANASEGELRLVVNDMDNKTEAEQKRFDTLLSQLNTDKNFHKLVVCEVVGGSKIVLYDSNTQDQEKKEIKAEEIIEVPFNVIENVPTLPECETLKTNEERKQCMSQFVSKHVAKNFNTDIADSLGIKGRQRIFVQFKIDKEGQVIGIKTRASHEVLEKEAYRVINMLPNFTPGMQKGKKVVVPYALPIVFQIAEKDSTTTATPNYKRFAEDLKKKDSLVIEETDASVIEKFPVHPDCKDLESDEERKKCTVSAVNKFMAKNFNTKMAASLDLPAGRQRIFVNFKIDKRGKVKGLEARASHKTLEKEALRVIKLLPDFIPGEKNGEKVEVPLSLPIVFMIAEDKKAKD